MQTEVPSIRLLDHGCRQAPHLELRLPPSLSTSCTATHHPHLFWGVPGQRVCYSLVPPRLERRAFAESRVGVTDTQSVEIGNARQREFRKAPAGQVRKWLQSQPIRPSCSSLACLLACLHSKSEQHRPTFASVSPASAATGSAQTRPTWSPQGRWIGHDQSCIGVRLVIRRASIKRDI